jgi:hypothetical protein
LPPLHLAEHGPNLFHLDGTTAPPYLSGAQNRFRLQIVQSERLDRRTDRVCVPHTVLLAN